MTKKVFRNNFVIALASSVLLVLSMVSCTTPQPSATKTMILYTRPYTTTYKVGENLSLTGLKVLDEDSGEQLTVATNPPAGYTFKVEDVGDFNITVSKENYNSLSFTVKVKSKEEDNKKTVRIYATNDIHGTIKESNVAPDIGVTMTYLKDRKAENPNTLLLDQGDTWQGSIYSNYNHGELLTDLMNYVHFDARTIGNHDFDWGVNYIINNTAKSYNGYQTPVLAANVYDYDFTSKITGSSQQNRIGIPSVSYELENGLKVGIVGTIGKEQISSITTTYAMDINFIDHIQVIKSEATKLRSQGCDIVIASNHCGQDSVLNNDLSNYVDLVLCAHSHQREQTYENGVLFTQYKAYNQYVGYIELIYDPDAKGRKVSYGEVSALTKNDIERKVDTIDSGIQSIIDGYNSECDEAANEVVASNTSGYWSSYEQLPNLMCNAIYEAAISEGYDVDLAYCNQGRASLKYLSSWNYADIYQSFPFDNIVYIIEVTYNEMINEIGQYNSVYHSEDFDMNLDQNKKYKVACIDHLAFHTNDNRDYDYFSDNAGASIGALSQNYRLILKDYLKGKGYSDGLLLSSDNYSTDSSICFSRAFN